MKRRLHLAELKSALEEEGRKEIDKTKVRFSGVSVQQLPIHKRYEDLLEEKNEWIHEEKRKALAKKVEEETKECTFKPRTNTKRYPATKTAARAESADTVKKTGASKA